MCTVCKGSSDKDIHNLKADVQIKIYTSVTNFKSTELCRRFYDIYVFVFRRVK